MSNFTRYVVVIFQINLVTFKNKQKSNNSFLKQFGFKTVE